MKESEFLIMSDGASIGVRAGRALGTILGGKEPPPMPNTVEERQAALQDLEKLIRTRPLPGDGLPVWKRDPKAVGDDAYSFAAECVAHCFLVLADDDPKILDTDTVYGPDNTDHKEMWGRLAGKDRASWEALKAKWPGADDWFGGTTGFMVGWAFNAARSIKGYGPVGNPAIITIGE